MKPLPPKWADRFLEWYCRQDLLEEIQGDSYELYYRLYHKSKRRADWMFVWNVVRFFRLKNISGKKIYPPGTMLRNYLLIGYRNSLRNGATSFINIFGLAIGIAGVITIFIFGDQFYHTDDFQVKRERIYQLTTIAEQGDRLATLGEVPYLLPPALKDESPAIEAMTRFIIRDGALRFGQHVFNESFCFVDPTFFDLFNFPMREGNTGALSAPGHIVFTRPMAEKYFGSVSALGKTVSLKFSTGETHEFTVAAVVDKPANSTMYFSFLLPLEAYEKIFRPENNWKESALAGFLLLKPGATTDQVKPLLAKYQDLRNAALPEWKTAGYKFYHFPDLTTRSYEIENGIAGSGEPQGVLALALIALLLLLLACFNYMNISIATVSTRLKEIGIRKVIGGQKREIVLQFVTENILLCSLSLTTGFLIAYFFFMPWLNALVTYKIPFAFSSAYTMVPFFVGLLVFIVLVSGLYPALFVSRHQPATILKGKEKFGQRSRLSRVLLTTQFVLAFTTIVGCFVFIDNSIYLKNKDWGYQHDQNLVVPVQSHDQFLALRDRLASQKNVINISGAVDHIGTHRGTKAVELPGKSAEVVVHRVGFNYLETMNLRLLAGRFFNDSIQSDRTESVVVNERFVKAMGWQNPIDQKFKQDNLTLHVVGVVSDFHYTDFYREILPVLFVIAPEASLRYVAVKVQAGSVVETEDWIKKAWKEIAPDDPYEGMLQDQVFSNWLNNNLVELKLMVFIATMTVLLACLGLYGLVSYNITRRLKEFSIRKVFGASMKSIFRLMNRDYIWILGLAFVIGAPAGFLLMNELLRVIYADPQLAGPVPFLLAVVLMVFTVAATIGSQIGRIVYENPVNTLRSE